MLLLSKSKAFPNGLSNNHGQVGRHYFSHHTGASVSALFPWNTNSWYGLPAQGVAVDNWADDNFDHGGLDFQGIAVDGCHLLTIFRPQGEIGGQSLVEGDGFAVGLVRLLQSARVPQQDGQVAWVPVIPAG